MQSQYDILKCLNYMENMLSVGHIKANYEKSLYRWYDEVGQTIMSGVKVDEKENRIKIKDFIGLLHKKTQKIQKLTPSVIEKNILLLGEIFHLNKNEMDLIGLMFRHTQYAFLNNFVEYFLGYHWERLDSYAMLLKLTYSQLMNMLREDGRLMQADIFSYDYHDRIELSSWVNRLLIGRYKNKKDMFDTIIGKPLKSKLNLTNFSHIEQVDIISLLLKNATKQKEKGINILLYGDVGSGKTEFAKVLAQENNLKLYSIAEDMGGSCNISYRRFNRLKAISQAFCKEDNIALMFDEIEDVFYNSPFQDRPNISKVEINRFLENNPKPIIWICNKIGYLDKAYLRRFSYIVRIERPNRIVNKDILVKNLKKYHIKYQHSDLDYIISKYNFTPAILENAAKVTNLVNGDISDMRMQLDAVEQAISGKSERLKKCNDFATFNMDLLNTDLDLKKFNEQISTLEKLNFSLCLYGASGTGKTAYANYLAQILGLEVLEKRASDLISAYVGETEKNIAEAFDEARKNKSVLIFDEGDSFLQDRAHATKSWEITQVNEMLTQMEIHPYPFICTTNLMTNIDKASLRRFTFKIKYDYMTDEQIDKAFKHFFGIELNENIMLKLTAGDFCVVKKKAEIMGLLQDKCKLIEMLNAEQESREPTHRRIGFI